MCGWFSGIGGLLRPSESKAELSVSLLHLTLSRPRKEFTGSVDLSGILGGCFSECVRAYGFVWPVCVAALQPLTSNPTMQAYWCTLLLVTHGKSMQYMQQSHA
ncbi:hypothetical protein ILYODFUR_021883 [Ilyodon furcidens]|uniref:Uncharacterized protein n=1 Tax=Ilyodon furcidens TaxID=33524 RepID=A0ABV0TYB9_9TELE